MKLHVTNTDDGYMLWGAYLTGQHNDGDGGINIYEEWFMVARTEQEVRIALGAAIEAESCLYRWYQGGPRIEYRPVSPMELVICSKSPGGRLNPVKLAGKSPAGFSVIPTLMDTRG